MGTVFVVVPSTEAWMWSSAMWVPGPGENFEAEPIDWPGMTNWEALVMATEDFARRLGRASAVSFVS